MYLANFLHILFLYYSCLDFYELNSQVERNRIRGVVKIYVQHFRDNFLLEQFYRVFCGDFKYTLKKYANTIPLMIKLNAHHK